MALAGDFGCRSNATHPAPRHAPSHRLALPPYEFDKPRLGRPNDLLIQRHYKRVERGVIEGFENPLAMLDPQVLQHRERLLAFLDDGAEQDHDLRHRRLQFERRGLWVGDCRR